MGTHPIFESDFDCLTEQKMNRLLARPVMQTMTRRTILSSGKTGGHGWYREGYTKSGAQAGFERCSGLPAALKEEFIRESTKCPREVIIPTPVSKLYEHISLGGK